MNGDRQQSSGAFPRRRLALPAHPGRLLAAAAVLLVLALTPTPEGSARSEEPARARGEGALVALVDTGAARVPALRGALAAELDFSGTGGGDGHGHGTYLASLMVGRDGVAPGAQLLSLKVADDRGRTEPAAVLDALSWLAGPGRAAGVEVAVLALGVDPASPGGELLDAAVDRLADLGVLVLAPSGNHGPGTLTAPASARGTVSVGALDDRGTAEVGDDGPAAFSGDGRDRSGVRQPDVWMDGTRVTGALAPGSVIATAHPEAQVGPGVIRGSGTSMATALAGGVAALVSAARPDLNGTGIARALTVPQHLDADAALEVARDLPPARAAGTRVGPRGSGFRELVDAATLLKPGRGPASTRPGWGSTHWGSTHWGSTHWGSTHWGSTHWGASHWSAAARTTSDTDRGGAERTTVRTNAR